MGLCIWRKLLTSGERMGKVMNGMRNGGKNMMPLEKLRNGPTNGAPLTRTHNLRRVMLMFGMKGTHISPSNQLKVEFSAFILCIWI